MCLTIKKKCHGYANTSPLAKHRIYSNALAFPRNVTQQKSKGKRVKKDIYEKYASLPSRESVLKMH